MPSAPTWCLGIKKAFGIHWALRSFKLEAQCSPKCSLNLVTWQFLKKVESLEFFKAAPTCTRGKEAA